MGLRVYREVDDGTTVTKTHLLWDHSAEVSRLIAEVDADTGNVERTYLHVGYQAVAVYEGEQVDPLTTRYFLLSDRLGSVRLVVDKTGAIKNRYTYTPYGEEITAETEVSVDQPFQFTGQYLEDSVQLYAFNARMYDPNLAIFLTHDPVRGSFSEPLTLHRYLYTLNDPVNNLDPTGEVAIAGSMVANSFRTMVSGMEFEMFHSFRALINGTLQGWSIEQAMMAEINDLATGAAIGVVAGMAAKAISRTFDDFVNVLDDLVAKGEKPITYGQLDKFGRPTGVMAIIRPEDLGTGTKVTGNIKPEGYSAKQGHHRGHLLGADLGGSGDVRENLAVMYSRVNQSTFRKIEIGVKKAVQNGETIRYSVYPVYEGASSVPVGFQVLTESNSGLMKTQYISNVK